MKKNKKNKKPENFGEFVEATKAGTAKVEKKSRQFWTDFKKFVAKGNVVDLAVAVVVGSAFNKMVTSLVNSIITPLTSLLLPDGKYFSDLKLVLRAGVEANEAAGIEEIPEIAITYGSFLQNALDFLLIAMSIYLALRAVMKLKNLIRRRELEAAEKRKKEEEAKKKAEAEALAAKEAETHRAFLANVAAQADLLAEIRDIMKRMEQTSADGTVTPSSEHGS